jgi:hypothetical protein
MHAFFGCRLKELRVEGDGGKIIIAESAFAFNPGLTAVTLGNCELGIYTFIGCPVGRVTLTGECVPTDTLEILGFGGCFNPCISDNFFETVWEKYDGALETYTLKGKLVKTNYKRYVHNTGKQMHYVDIEACEEKCGDIRCYTLAGFEDERGKEPVFKWEKMEKKNIHHSTV